MKRTTHIAEELRGETSLQEEIERAKKYPEVEDSIGSTIESLKELLKTEAEKNIQRMIKKFRMALSSAEKNAIQNNELPLTVRVSACRKKEDFLKLFQVLGIPSDKWENCGWLQKNDYIGIVKAIGKDSRFKDIYWKGFLEFMGKKTEAPMTERIASCKTSADFLKLFRALGIKGDEWKSSNWLDQNGFAGVYLALKKGHRFKDVGWKGFLEFMGEKIEIPLTEQIASCKTPSGILKLIRDLGIKGDEWESAGWLQSNGYCALYSAIKKHPLFKKTFWPGFLKFMGKEDAVSPKKQITGCKNKNDFLRLFRSLKIDKENWMSAFWLQRNGFSGLYSAIVNDLRFEKNGFKDFLRFMGIEIKVPLRERVASCKKPTQFLKLFRELGLENSEWESGLESKYSNLYQAIIHDLRFAEDKIAGFYIFMGVLKEETMSQIIAKCVTPDDFLQLFHELDIPRNAWRSSHWLEKNERVSVYLSIVRNPRFQETKWQGFLQFMDYAETDKHLENISKLNLEELFSIFADRPAQMKLYLQANYPSMTVQEIDQLILQGFKSFFGISQAKDAEYQKYNESLPPIRLKKSLPEKTKKPTIIITGTAKDAHYIYLSGTGSRRCKVDKNGHFEAIVPLRIGKKNEIFLTAVHPTNRQRSPLFPLAIDQCGEVDDVQELIRLLSTMGNDVMDSITLDPGKYEHIQSRLKHVLIRKFSKNFDEGERYIRSKIDGNHSRVIKRMLREILAEFRDIDQTDFPNIRSEEPLYLFQKYCALLIQKQMEQGKPGVILANDPGLGKTRTVLAAINGEDAVIVAPNSVVSGWSEEAAKCMKNPDLLVMQDMPHATRMKVLKESKARHRVTNIQFVRKHMDEERFELLANEDTVVVQDEAHSRANLQSDQTRGMQKLSKIGKFQLLISATPFKNSKTVCRVLHTLYPDREEFSSDAAFEKAFPSNDPKALQMLNLLLEEDVIRFTKRDALEEMDPNIPIIKQYHKLPRKEHIPPEAIGEFEMSQEQAYVIYEMFLNWAKWTKKYGKYVPKDKVARLDHMRNGDALSKRHAYRQVINNPEYIGLDGVSNTKARLMQSIVEKSIREGRKVEIFCAYNAQANLYAEILKRYKPALYTGVTSDQGWKKDGRGRPQFFRKNIHGQWEFDNFGYLIPDSEGEPILSMDYERLSFQNAPERKVIIATYAAGAVGTTFTAAKTVIKDDLPRDCIEDEQSDDRTHRIDHEHQTHHTVKHYHLISRYPQKFLNAMKKKWVVKQDDGTYKEYESKEVAQQAARKSEADVATAYEMFFEQRTWDEVHFENLRIQRQMMHLILDGIADESVLTEDQKKLRGIDE